MLVLVLVLGVAALANPSVRMVRLLIVGGVSAQARAGTRAHARTNPGGGPAAAAGSTPSAGFAVLSGVILFAPAGGRRSGRTLPWNGQMSRHRLQIEHLADEVAQRDDEFGRMYGAARGKFSCGVRRQPDLFLRPQQNDVG